MTHEINETHDPNLRSWVESANDPNTDFPIQNLPFCVFSGPESDSYRRIGVRIGDKVFDLQNAVENDTRFFRQLMVHFVEGASWANLSYALESESEDIFSG